ncbi:hypothetical protein MNBD_BACTEROID03-633 [hydrothermal vent metagenome]|uniref:Outer membrane protein beta-barrel domain-containing protein n=1 Tax=hydrothermal vent metagenome TaxID=652676 RepID=A0A3B0TZ03_9ZZZZ
MKNLIMISVILFVGSFSSTAYGQFIVKGGPGVSGVTMKERGGVRNSNFRSSFSFHVGGAYEIEVSDFISIEPGVSFTGKGFNVARRGTDLNARMLFIEVPIAVKGYFLDIGDGGRLFGLAGGYTSFMLSYKLNGVKQPIGNTTEDRLKRFDMGLTFGAGVELFESLVIVPSFDFGLANLSNTSNEINRINVFKLTVGYKF